MSTPSPIATLPVEILQGIFLETLPNFQESAQLDEPLQDLMVPARLGAVSRFWRQLSIATEELWTMIHVIIGNGQRDQGMSLQSVLLWLQRCRGRPWTLVLKNSVVGSRIIALEPNLDDFWAFDMPILAAILPLVSKLKKLYLELEPDVHWFPTLNLTDSPIALFAQLPHMPYLQHVDAVLIADEEQNEENLLTQVIEPLLKALCTNVANSPIRQLHLIVEGRERHRLSFGTSLQTVPLTSLKLSHPDMPSLLALLSSTPYLRELTIDSEDLRSETSSIPQHLLPPSPILLNALLSLTLIARFCPDFFLLLNNIVAPRLQDLEFSFHEARGTLPPARRGLINFLSRSQCPIEHLKLDITINSPQAPAQDLLLSYPFPLQGRAPYWETIQTMQINSHPNAAALLLCELCKNLTSLKVNIEEGGYLPTDPFIGSLPNLTSLCMSSPGIIDGRSHDSFPMRMIAPALRRLTIEFPVPFLIPAIASFLSTSQCSLEVLSMLSLGTLGSEHIIQILCHPSARSISTLYLECSGSMQRFWLDGVLDYLSYIDSGSIVLPSLRRLNMWGALDCRIGHVGRALDFRFKEANLKTAGVPLGLWKRSSDHVDDMKTIDKLIASGYAIADYAPLSVDLS